MNYLKLKNRLHQLLNLDADIPFQQFHNETGSQDIDRFIAYLREKKLINTAVFVELAAAHEIEVTRVPQAEAGGTLSAGTGLMRVLKSTQGHGRHALLGILGKGAMGEVFIAKDIDLRRNVAFKRMVPEVAGNARLASRFFEEVQVTAQLDHPNIVPIYGLEVGEDGALGYAMKLVQGKTFEELLEEARQHGSRSNARVEADRLSTQLDYFLKVCDAMSYAHNKGVLHRDLKPENIMVGRYGEVFVMDWGICRLIGSAGAESDSLVTVDGAGPTDDPGKRTQYGAVLGTLRYMSPEQALGKNPELDGRSDLYTLGLILQEVVTLKPAVQAVGQMALLAKAAQGQREAVVHIDGGIRIASELKSIIARATMPKKEERYPSVAALGEDLRRYLRGESVSAHADSFLQGTMRWMSRHRAATLVTMLVLLLAGAGATIGLLVRSEQQLTHQRKHERRLQTYLAAVSQHAHRIDNTFNAYEAGLQELVGRTLEALRNPMPVDKLSFYYTSDFDTPGRAPPDTEPSVYYKASISLRRPSFKLAPGLSLADVERDVNALNSLGPALREMMIASHGEHPEEVSSEDARKLITSAGVPVLRAFITLANGVHCAFPGLGGFPPEYDGRKRPKYKLAEEKHGIQWGNPYPDRYGHGLLLPSGMSLYDDKRRFLGVAGFDMTFDYIIAHLLDLPGGEISVTETLLVDDKGRVVIRSVPGRKTGSGEGYGDARDELKPDLKGDEPVQLHPLRFPEVVEAIQARKNGFAELDGDQVVAYTRLDALGWYYVAVADGIHLFAKGGGKPLKKAAP